MENIIDDCGFCGKKLPPYPEWKLCLCPECDKGLSISKLMEIE